MINRRSMLQGMAAAAAIGQTRLPGSALWAPKPKGRPKRVIFFLQNQGFDPKTCVPEGMGGSGPLAGVTLPEPISPLEPYKDKIHIINGLHGRHTSPGHSAFFGALGGYRGGIGVPPAAATIDHVLSQRLPKTILPHLCIGMDSIENMRSRPTLATLSASGPGQPLFMHSNPTHLYEMLFGGIASGDVKKRFEARSKVFRQVERIAGAKSQGLPTGERRRYGSYVEGFREINGLREQLNDVADHLKQFVPEYGDKFVNPKFETDWHDSLLEIGVAVLRAGLTNVLTIGSGRGEIFGAWKGLGIVPVGHSLGHMKQPGNEIWTKIRQYNCRMLVQLMTALEAMPEGDGTMMDNTLIVYTSNNAEKQHTRGQNWPFILLGNCAGRIKTGQFTQMNGKRPINALYATLMHAVGAPCERFNMDDASAGKLDPETGPIQALLT